MPCMPKQYLDLNLELVKSDVCDALYVNLSDVFGHSRKSEFKYGRWMIWKIMRSHGFSLRECGDMSGHDHTTVINAMNNIDEDIANIEYISKVWDKVKKHYKPKSRTTKKQQ